MSKRLLKNTPVWENSVGLLGLVLIILTFSSLFVVALKKNGDTPLFTFQVKEIAQISNGYLVHVEVQNIGDVTAENLQLGVSLLLAEGEEERVSIFVEYFAPMVVQDFQFFFSRNPDLGELSFYPLSYQIP